jgi:hypothetical protein
MRSSTVAALLLLALPQTSAKVIEPDQELRYNPATVVDITGIVEDIREVTSPAAVRGIHFLLRTENDASIDVYVGPTWFVKEFVASFGKRSEVEVTGSKVKSGGAAIILAREVRRGVITLYLRDRQGKPFWNETTTRINAPNQIAVRVVPFSLRAASHISANIASAKNSPATM